MGGGNWDLDGVDWGVGAGFVKEQSSDWTSADSIAIIMFLDLPSGNRFNQWYAQEKLHSPTWTIPQ
jgi:hypothetical protein